MTTPTARQMSVAFEAHLLPGDWEPYELVNGEWWLTCADDPAVLDRLALDPTTPDGALAWLKLLRESGYRWTIEVNGPVKNVIAYIETPQRSGRVVAETDRFQPSELDAVRTIVYAAAKTYWEGENG